MRHQRTIRIKRGSKVVRQNTNFTVVKLLDPVFQSLMLVAFLFALDDVVMGYSYRFILLVLVGWQFISSIFNFFIKDPKILRNERIIYLVINVCYMLLFFYLERHLKEKIIALDETEQPFLNVYQSILMSGAVLLAFWYNLICFREIKAMLGGMNKGD